MRTASAILHAARDLPVGPSFVSSLWTGGGSAGSSGSSGSSGNELHGEGDDNAPSLVMVVVTRVTAWGALIPAFVLVDRTCLGVKSALLGAPRTQDELEEDLATLAQAHGPLAECPFLLAQSVVFNAIEYARSLGFEPHADFPAPYFEPRPKELLDTPFSRPAYPIYIVGPGDPVERILSSLDSAVGAFNYAFMPCEPRSASGSLLAGDIDAFNAFDASKRHGHHDDDEASAAAG